MKNVWFIADSIVSPLGLSSEANYDAVRRNVSGIQYQEHSPYSAVPFYASLVETEEDAQFTRFESMAVRTISAAIKGLSLPAEETILILSTTKGNIELLASDRSHPRISLHASASHIAKYFGFGNVQVVSNACISGALALLVAQRSLAAGKYRHAIVVGAEVLSQFIISGFQSLHALSPEPCKPFDRDRTGITLGEAAACVVLSTEQRANDHSQVRITGGGLSNDANHISGPSRTGKELSVAIDHALKSIGIPAGEIDFISAHGTATVYNDEMEAKAFGHSGIEDKPLHSLKGYYGHTLGAAGVLETVIALHALRNDELIPSRGFSALGVSIPVNIVQQLEKRKLKRVLKTASGFGGCNAAIILEKV
jgi:3-oxoacyl-[acyl-carrier-protein] synthase I